MLRKIDNLLIEQNLKREDLIYFLEMSKTGFLQMFDNDTIKVRTLKRIAKFFNKPIIYFLEEDEKIKTVNEPIAIYGKNKKNKNFYVQYWKKIAEERKQLIDTLVKQNELLANLLEKKITNKK